MASILKVDDLRGNTSAGDITITKNSVTYSLQDVLPHTYTLYDHQNTAIDLSLNVSSVTDESTGNFYLNIATATATLKEYISHFSAEDWYSNGGTSNSVRHSTTTSTTKLYYRHFENGSARDTQYNHVTVMGDLA